MVSREYLPWKKIGHLLRMLGRKNAELEGRGGLEEKQAKSGEKSAEELHGGAGE